MHARSSLTPTSTSQARGKGGLELALKHIQLVQNPPRGTKKTIVDALSSRASSYDLEKKTGRAMVDAGLLKTVRKGLFGKAVVMPRDDE